MVKVANSIIGKIMKVEIRLHSKPENNLPRLLLLKPLLILLLLFSLISALVHFSKLQLILTIAKVESSLSSKSMQFIKAL